MISIDGLCTDSDVAHLFDDKYRSVLDDQNIFDEVICSDGVSGNIYIHLLHLFNNM